MTNNHYTPTLREKLDALVTFIIATGLVIAALNWL